ncbi:MAG: class I SAM-dependent methyltransferase [Actinomycetota bacterium]|nr:class I SAM-dependent methyltransferase [Actinomycetota bacterium]
MLPRHFYSAVPDIRQLRTTHSWREPRSMTGVAGLDLAEQTAILRKWLPESLRSRLAARDIYAEACAMNGAEGYGPTEAVLLYAFIATQRPTHVLQVGAGVSTAVILAAADDFGLDLKLSCVDPYPTALLRRLAVSGRIDLIEERGQDVPLETFTALPAGGLLFVDSTHTVKPDSEVNRIVLEILPRLSAGVVVHFHDISLPYDYPRDLLDGALFFWTESVLLHAFLIHNSRCRVLLATSVLHYAASDKLSEVVPGYQPEQDVAGLRISGAPKGHFSSAAYLLIHDGDNIT